MNFRQRHCLYIVLGIASIAGGLTLGADPRAAAQSALQTDVKGWKDIAPSAGLEGWTRLPLPAAGVLGKAQWQRDSATGNLVCAGDGGHDWLRYDRELEDFVYHVEWRLPADAKSGTGGVYFRNSGDGRVWHQAQAGSAGGGFFFGNTPVGGALQSFSLADQVKDSRVKPAGEWNTFEITCRGPIITLWVNGAVTNSWTDCQAARGFIGLEGEGSRIEFRSIKLKELPPLAVN